MSLLRTRILPTLAFLAVACAQVFGVQRGYVCNHDDVVVVTDSEHCHRVVVGDRADEVPCEENSTRDCDDKGEKEHHAPLTVDMQAAPSTLTAVSIPVFVGVLVAVTWAHDWVRIHALVEHEWTRMPLDTGGGSLPASLQVARCMVILV